jgi:glucose/mannose-6-phosphate isomerase
MKQLIQNFSAQLESGIEIGKNFNYSPPRQIKNVILSGIGGSGFGGEVIKRVFESELTVPFVINRTYTIPAFAGPETLVIISSYSGNTEETLEAFEHYLTKGCMVVAITSGGKVKEISEKQGFPVQLLPGGFPPRAAAGFSIVQQLFILRHLNLIQDFTPALEETISIIKHFSEHADAEMLAQKMKNRLPVIYCSEVLEPAAIRLKQQINENSKQLCYNSIVPEMNHNEIVGWEYPDSVLSNILVLFLHSSFDHSRVETRFGITAQVAQGKAGEVAHITAKGSSLLAQNFYLIHFFDWVSLYLAELNSVDPMPVKIIDFLKSELGKI